MYGDKNILAESHNSIYSIDPSDTNMYHNMQKVYSWNGIKIDIADFVAMCLIANK